MHPEVPRDTKFWVCDFVVRQGKGDLADLVSHRENVSGVGAVVQSMGRGSHGPLRDVRIVPDQPYNLVSVRQILDTTDMAALVFTRTRSGSRWFVDTVRRLGENVANAKELAFDGRHEAFAEACASATPSPACVCALRRVFARAHAERRNSYRTALGFKFMTHIDTSEARAEINVASVARGRSGQSWA